MSKPSIEVRDLAKIYRIYGNPYNRLREMLPWNRGRKLHREVAALRDITFAVEPGQCVGMIGKNGAGKSTLLKVLTGTTFPTHGSYTVRGRVSSLLELGAGFHADFTGRENIYMNAAMMGFSRREAQRKFAEIVDFSGLGDFIDAPIRTYSSGMICRLGFSVAVATDPDVLIIDEILAVGDLEFQRRCVDKIWDYKKRGKTMFFCSHSLYDVRQICERAIWLRNGRIHQLGDAVSVTNDYAAFENQTRDVPDELPMDQLPAAPGVDPVQPDDRDLQQPRIVDAVLIDPATGAERNEFSTGDAVGVRVVVRNGREPVPLVVGVGAMRKDGTLCFAHSSEWGGQRLVDSEFEITLTLPQVRLLSGEFNVPVWLLDENGVHRYHQRPARQQLIVRNRTKDLGLFLQEHDWQVRAVQRKD